jgi:hypothetical protein
VAAEGERSRGLTQAELAEVLRRAAELDSQRDLPVPVDRYDPADVEDAAAEVGLSREAVRRALHEVLHPDERIPDVYAEGRLPSRELVLAREVPGTAEEIEAQVARFLRRQLFEQKRVFADGSRWAPRSGWVASVQKGIDPGGRLVLKQVRAVQVTLSEMVGPGDGPARSVLVRISLDLSGVRSIHTTWLGVGGAAGGAAVVGTAVAVGLDPLVVASLPAAGALTYGGHLIGRREARSEVEKIHTSVAGLLDRLEHGDRVESRPRRRSSTRPRPRDRDRNEPTRDDGQEDDE